MKKFCDWLIKVLTYVLGVLWIIALTALSVAAVTWTIEWAINGIIGLVG